TPACDVRGEGVLNVCELAERGPVVLGFLATRGGDCTAEFDRLERLHREFPAVQVAAVSIRGDRDELRGLIREHGWRYPVGYDADGILANLYGVAVCPHLTFAYPGGEVRGTVLGAEPEAALRGRFERLLAASRERGWRPGA
ncbi:MAG TPA: TlpA disulfide reductase family protein, partial [Capillimicrobium sp.]|nr:TlpA disulfide reductase family protein [Capillimicrobium sp.]